MIANESNPYAPPNATVAASEPNSHGLKRRSLLVMVVFMIITFGVYYLTWWFRRRAGLNRLNSAKKLEVWPLALLTAFFVVQFGVGLVTGISPDEEVIGASGELLLSLFQLAVGIVMILQTFRIKDMIEDHVAPESQSRPMFVEHVKLSGLMTFFLSIFYLQWAINRYVAGTQSWSTNNDPL